MSNTQDIVDIVHSRPLIQVRTARYWVQAVALQALRVLRGYSSPIRRQDALRMDEHFLLIAVGKAARWLQAAKRKGLQICCKQAIKAYLVAVATGVDLRDLREHDEEYDTGRGRNRAKIHAVVDSAGRKMRVDHNINVMSN